MAEQTVVTILEPHLRGRVEITVKGEGTRLYKFEGEFPNEVKIMFDQFLGNAALRVSCSKDFKMADFGTGVSASFTVSASCNQGDAGDTAFHETAKLVKHYAQAYATQAFAEAEQELKALLASRNRSDAFKF